VFALNDAVETPSLELLRPRAVRWQTRLSLPFRRWVTTLRAVPHSSQLRRIPPARRVLAARAGAAGPR
jgi:hypothetical protein